GEAAGVVRRAARGRAARPGSGSRRVPRADVPGSRERVSRGDARAHQDGARAAGDHVRSREPRAAPIPRRRDAGARRVRCARLADGADARAARARVGRRRVALRAVELLRRAVDLVAERPRGVGAAVRDPAHVGRWRRSAPVAHGRVVRTPAGLLAGACVLNRPRSSAPLARAGGPFDLKIAGATVIDGTGTTGGRADVGITDGVIAAVGDLSREHAGTTLNASGKVLAPGFIDMHSHSDWRLWENRRAESKIRQGVTTEVVGNCGFSPAPVSTEFLDDLRGFASDVPKGMTFEWRTFGEYLAALDADGLAVNVLHLVGHGALRIAAMGFARRPP